MKNKITAGDDVIFTFAGTPLKGTVLEKCEQLSNSSMTYWIVESKEYGNARTTKYPVRVIDLEKI